MRILSLIILFLLLTACATNTQYYPKNMPDFERKNRWAQQGFGEEEEPPIYNYKNTRAYRILSPFSAVTVRVEKYKDNSCLLVAKWVASSSNSYSNYIGKEKVILEPIVELRVPIKQECDKFIPFDELDSLYKDEQYHENKGLNWKKDCAYSDWAYLERVTEDGTYYYQSTRDKKEVEKIIETVRKIWNNFVGFDIHKAN